MQDIFLGPGIGIQLNIVASHTCTIYQRASPSPKFAAKVIERVENATTLTQIDIRNL
jgi:hypothetical protein